MYMPGRFRTASSPLRTWICPASYFGVISSVELIGVAIEQAEDGWPKEDRKIGRSATPKDSPGPCRKQRFVITLSHAAAIAYAARDNVENRAWAISVIPRFSA